MRITHCSSTEKFLIAFLFYCQSSKYLQCSMVFQEFSKSDLYFYLQLHHTIHLLRARDRTFSENPKFCSVQISNRIYKNQVILSYYLLVDSSNIDQELYYHHKAFLQWTFHLFLDHHQFLIFYYFYILSFYLSLKIFCITHPSQPFPLQPYSSTGK